METKFKKGDIVRVTRNKTVPVGKKTKTEETDTRPTIGKIVFVHPEGCFCTVEFRDKHTAEYKRMYPSAFRPEELEHTTITTSEFEATRPAQKKSWMK